MRVTTILCLTLLSVFNVALAEDAVVTPPRASIVASNTLAAPTNAPAFMLPWLEPADVVQDSIKIRRGGTKTFGVMWTYTEAGAQKALAFWDAHPGPRGRFSEKWKSGWLKWRTDKSVFETEDAAKAFMARLKIRKTDG